jgi:hypothetical protein
MEVGEEFQRMEFIGWVNSNIGKHRGRQQNHAGGIDTWPAVSQISNLTVQSLSATVCVRNAAAHNENMAQQR